MNNTKDVKDFYNENCKALKKKVENTRRCKDLPCLGFGRINIVKMDQITKTDKCILHQNPNYILYQHRKNNQIHMKTQKTSNNQINPEQYG
jgi:hypothetical protein